MATQKYFLASGRIELFSSHHGLKPRHERLQLSQHAFSPHRALIGAAVTDRRGSPNVSRNPLQRPAHRRLTQETSFFCRTGDMALLQKRMEGMYEVQIQVT